MPNDPGWLDIQRTLGFFIVGAFVAIIVLLVFHTPPDNATTIWSLIGSVGTMAAGVVTYYFGSSKGSSDKDNSRDATLTTLVNKVVTNGEPPKPPTENKP